MEDEVIETVVDAVAPIGESVAARFDVGKFFSWPVLFGIIAVAGLICAFWAFSSFERAKNAANATD